MNDLSRTGNHNTVLDPMRYLALGVIADAMQFPLYATTDRPNVYRINNHPITFANLLWLLDPLTRDFWFEIAGLDFYRVRRKLIQTDAFNLLLDKIEKNKKGAEYYEQKLIDFEIPVQQMLDERRLKKTKKKIPYWKQKQNGG